MTKLERQSIRNIRRNRNNEFINVASNLQQRNINYGVPESFVWEFHTEDPLAINGLKQDDLENTMLHK